MIMKFCPRCKTLHPVDKQCPNGCGARKEENRLYDKYLRKNKSFYNSSQWDKLRKECMNKYDSICLYTLFKYNKITPATLVHHIIELTEDKTQAYELSNLIPVSDIAHREIHKRYKDENLKEVQAELKSYLEKYVLNFLEG